MVVRGYCRVTVTTLFTKRNILLLGTTVVSIVISWLPGITVFVNNGNILLLWVTVTSLFTNGNILVSRRFTFGFEGKYVGC